MTTETQTPTTSDESEEVTMYFDIQLVKDLKEIAAALNTDLSTVVNTALRSGLNLNDEEKGEKAK